jgi:hypothetical protein
VCVDTSAVAKSYSRAADILKMEKLDSNETLDSNKKVEIAKQEIDNINKNSPSSEL